MTRILAPFGGLSCTHSLLHSSGAVSLNRLALLRCRQTPNKRVLLSGSQSSVLVCRIRPQPYPETVPGYGWVSMYQTGVSMYQVTQTIIDHHPGPSFLHIISTSTTIHFPASDFMSHREDFLRECQQDPKYPHDTLNSPYHLQKYFPYTRRNASFHFHV